MSEASSPGKVSLTSWWKQFKKNEQLTSPPPISLRNNTPSSSASSQSGQGVTSPLLGPTSVSPTRPFLGYKSRSTHSVRPLSTYAENNNSQEKIRQQRDSFLHQRQIDYVGDSTVFGCPLEESVKIAEAKIYISSDKDGLVRYGRIPRVVALCGSYLKKNGLDVEGIFRVAGSTKRIKQLQLIFSSAPDYGSKIDWDGFTVHDAASLLRRFLGSLPEPLIPLSLYESFREPLRSRPTIVKYLKDKEKKMVESESTTNTSQATQTEQAYSNTANLGLSSTETKANTPNQPKATAEETKSKKRAKKEILRKERKEALKEYAELFDRLPELQRQLLFYILDLLAIFNSHFEKNLMPAKNLAAIFQPSILFHSDHDMSPEEYALSSLVIEFMIEYSYKILPAAQAAQVSKDTKNAAAATKCLAEVNIQAMNESQTTVPTLSTVSSSANSSNNIPAPSGVTSSLPPRSTYITRKHSKSLSSVQSPSDMLRVNNSSGRLKLMHSNHTDELDSAVDTEDDEVSRPIMPKSNRPSINSVISQNSLSPIKAPSLAQTPLPYSSPARSPVPLEQPPTIRVNSFDPGSATSIHSKEAEVKYPASPTSTSSIGGGSISSPSHLLHGLSKPLNFLSSPRLRASSIDDNLTKKSSDQTNHSASTHIDDSELNSTQLLDANSGMSDEERESRWEGSTGGSDRKKWFKKLRSRSSSTSRK